MPSADGNPVGLVEFLTQRLIDQMALVRQVQAQAVTDRVDPADPRFPALSLARIVEADIAAKRRIIELHKPDQLGFGPDVIGCCTCDAVLPETWGPDLLQPGQQLYPCETALLLAAPFSSHPDWQPEWSVE